MTLKALMQQYVEYKNLHQLEGVVPTSISGIRFYRKSTDQPRQPMLHESGIIVLGQGHKNIYAYGEVVSYGYGDCVILGVPMPLECDAMTDQGAPLLGIGIDIPIVLLQKIVSKIKAHRQPVPDTSPLNALSIRVYNMEARMKDVCKRILQALCNDMEAEILGEALLEELVYQALLSEGGSVLFELADKEGRYARIASVLEHIHQHYPEPFNVQDLASGVNMSVSAFHTAFRNVTLESPIQYIKKVRLNKARELICFEGRKVNDAARLVGYSSASQFSREFKRHFNESPGSTSL